MESLFGKQSFSDEEKNIIQSLLETKMNPNNLSTRIGAGMSLILYFN